MSVAVAPNEHLEVVPEAPYQPVGPRLVRALTRMAVRVALWWLALAFIGRQAGILEERRLLVDPVQSAALAVNLPVSSTAVTVSGVLPAQSTSVQNLRTYADRILQGWGDASGSQRWQARESSTGPIHTVTYQGAARDGGEWTITARGNVSSRGNVQLEIRRLWPGMVQDLRQARMHLVGTLRTAAGLPFARVDDSVLLEGWSAAPLRGQSWDTVVNTVVARTGAKRWMAKEASHRYELSAYTPRLPRHMWVPGGRVNLMLVVERQGSLWRISIGSPVVAQRTDSGA